MWSLDQYLDSMLMNKQDLRQFKVVQRKLEEKESVETIYIRASEAPTPSQTHGGPVFMALGEVVELDVVGDHPKRRLDEEVAATNSTDDTAKANNATSTAEGDNSQSKPAAEAEKTE